MEWISVKDELPGTAADCLVVLKDKGVGELQWACFRGDMWEDWSWDELEDEVTHWMYLSKIPLPNDSTSKLS